MSHLCEFDGCERLSRRMKLCAVHRRQLQRGQSLSEAAFRPRKPHNQGPCGVESCGRPVRSMGLCSSHYSQSYRGDWPSTPGSKAGFTVNEDGYFTWAGKIDGKSRTIAQHRVVMEEILGRDLLPGENVHHINGVRDDNRPENLELWVTSQPSGQRPRDLVNWANEILARYGG